MININILEQNFKRQVDFFLFYPQLHKDFPWNPFNSSTVWLHIGFIVRT